MSKKMISIAMFNAMVLRLSDVDFVFSKNSSNDEMYFFKKELDDIRVVLTYTVSGRGRYSAFGRLKIIYKDLTQILFELFEGSQFAQDYDWRSEARISAGVGISSEVGRYSPDNNTFYCGSIVEADEFAINFSRQIIAEEENFVYPRMDLAVTVKDFMKPIHSRWPGSLRGCLEHLVASGIKSSDPSLVRYAFAKLDEVSKKINPDAYPRDFIDVMEQRVKNMEFMKNKIAK